MIDFAALRNVQQIILILMFLIKLVHRDQESLSLRHNMLVILFDKVALFVRLIPQIDLCLVISVPIRPADIRLDQRIIAVIVILAYTVVAHDVDSAILGGKDRIVLSTIHGGPQGEGVRLGRVVSRHHQGGDRRAGVSRVDAKLTVGVRTPGIDLVRRRPDHGELAAGGDLDSLTV